MYPMSECHCVCSGDEAVGRGGTGKERWGRIAVMGGKRGKVVRGRGDWREIVAWYGDGGKGREQGRKGEIRIVE